MDQAERERRVQLVAAKLRECMAPFADQVLNGWIRGKIEKAALEVLMKFEQLWTLELEMMQALRLVLAKAGITDKPIRVRCTEDPDGRVHFKVQGDDSILEKVRDAMEGIKLPGVETWTEPPPEKATPEKAP